MYIHVYIYTYYIYIERERERERERTPAGWADRPASRGGIPRPLVGGTSTHLAPYHDITYDAEYALCMYATMRACVHACMYIRVYHILNHHTIICHRAEHHSVSNITSASVNAGIHVTTSTASGSAVECDMACNGTAWPILARCSVE